MSDSSTPTETTTDVAPEEIVEPDTQNIATDVKPIGSFGNEVIVDVPSEGHKPVAATSAEIKAALTVEIPDDLEGAAERPVLEQHPGLVGEPTVEVAERSADVHAVKSDTHVKVFVLPPDLKVGTDFDHAPNFGATRQYMMSQGMRPVGDVIYKGSKKVEGGLELTYEVGAVPTILTDDPAVKWAEAPQPTK